MVKIQETIFENDTKRTQGNNALKSNIEAAIAVSDIVKTTLGPMGMDKMLIDAYENIVITNDGVKILKEMEIKHPGAKLLVDVAKTQEAEVGDGTTTAVILSGELLNRAFNLVNKKIHPTNIVRNYNLASKKSQEILKDISINIDIDDEKIIRNICETAMTGKVSDNAKVHLSKILFDLVSLVKEDNGILKNRIKITKAQGGEIEDSFIVKGVVLDKELANSNMPIKQINPNVLLIDFPLEIRELDSDAKVNINSVNEYEEFIENEKNFLKSIVFKIKEVGANVVICQKGIDDSVAYYLAKEKISAIRRTRRSDLEKLSSALGVNIVSSYDDLKKDNLGICEIFERRQILNENYIFIEGCKNPKSSTLFLKASTTHVLDEIERAVEDSLGDLNSIIKSRKIVAGGGAIEIELYLKLIEFANSYELEIKEIIEEFANSFLSIPKILCENCGLDINKTIENLILNHKNGKINSGINSYNGICDNTLDYGIIEPINVKEQAIKSATEISSMILRIDDIIVAKKLENNQF